jgi:hypothetical protein
VYKEVTPQVTLHPPILYLFHLRWFRSLPDGPIRRLGSQLAEDGCPDSQVVLAKQLLEDKCGLWYLHILSLYINFITKIILVFLHPQRLHIYIYIRNIILLIVNFSQPYPCCHSHFIRVLLGIVCRILIPVLWVYYTFGSQEYDQKSIHITYTIS